MSTALHTAVFEAPPQAPDTKRSLVGLSREELTALMAEIGEPAFRARQLWHWIYHRGETDFDKMTSLAKPFRAGLAERFTVGRPGISVDRQSIDGTRKWLLKFQDGQEAESVHIPEEDRGTLCVSSQVGCTLTCKFCHTGTQRLVRNLTAGEILNQILAARDRLGDFPGGTRPSGGRSVPFRSGNGCSRRTRPAPCRCRAAASAAVRG